MNFGASGISWPVPLSLMKNTMSFSTSHVSRASRIFSQDCHRVSTLRRRPRRGIWYSHTASSLTQTVEAMFAYVHRLLLVKSRRSSSRSWNFLMPISAVESLVLLIRTHIARCLPLLVPTARGLFEDLHSRFVVAAVGCKLDLRLLQLCLVLTFFLTHYHVSLSKISLDTETILLIAISSLQQCQRGVSMNTSRSPHTLFMACVCWIFVFRRRSMPF